MLYLKNMFDYIILTAELLRKIDKQTNTRTHIFIAPLQEGETGILTHLSDPQRRNTVTYMQVWSMSAQSTKSSIERRKSQVQSQAVRSTLFYYQPNNKRFGSNNL